MSRARARSSAGTGDDESGCSILHVDMDAFFASVELARRPQLVGRPVIVGGAERGVVLAATYEARALGVHSAMPMTTARRLCPQAVVVPPDHARYHEVSRSVMAALGEITALVEQVSVDEAFLDVSGARRRLGPPTRIAAALRRRVQADHGITCSVGIATTKFVAKLASTHAKPDGMLLVPAAATVPFLRTLPVGGAVGRGERTEAVLAQWGIRTVAELADTDVASCRRPSARSRAPTCTTSHGVVTRGPSSPSARSGASGRRRPSSTTCATSPPCRRACSSSPTGAPAGSGTRASWPAR